VAHRLGRLGVTLVHVREDDEVQTTERERERGCSEKVYTDEFSYLVISEEGFTNTLKILVAEGFNCNC
jgi:hypothetical protein